MMDNSPKTENPGAQTNKESQVGKQLVDLARELAQDPAAYAKFEQLVASMRNKNE